MKTEQNSLKSFIREVERKIDLFLASLISHELSGAKCDREVLKYATVVEFLLRKKEVVRNVSSYESAREIQSQIYRLMENIKNNEKQ